MIKDLIEKYYHTLVICPDSYKEEILESLYREKLVCDVKFMSLEEYRKKYYFDTALFIYALEKKDEKSRRF